MTSNYDALEWFRSHESGALFPKTRRAYALAAIALSKRIGVEPKFYNRQSGLYYCPTCGSPLGPEFRFCSFCGQRIERVESND